MARRKRNRLLVPEAREALDALMKTAAPKHTKVPHIGPANEHTQVVDKVAHSLGIPYKPDGDNGNLTTREAGRIGGQIGGSIVQKLVQIAEETLAKESRK